MYSPVLAVFRRNFTHHSQTCLVLLGQTIFTLTLQTHGVAVETRREVIPKQMIRWEQQRRIMYHIIPYPIQGLNSPVKRHQLEDLSRVLHRSPCRLRGGRAQKSRGHSRQSPCSCLEGNRSHRALPATFVQEQAPPVRVFLSSGSVFPGGARGTVGVHTK